MFEGATVIAHENAVEPIRGERLPTALPTRTFKKDMTLELGGEAIELHHVGPSHSNSLSLIYFPKYKALQCTDICGSDTMPYSDLPDFYYDGWVESLRWVLAQDVEIVDDGHHPLATRKQQKAMLDYLTDLHDQVLALVRAGKSWDETQRLVVFSENVKKWPDFEKQRSMNILGMYRWVTTHRRGAW
jgi:glyoxylase-like metal-dependent hydrolase (beta-lactamase superfamily II)